MADAIPAKSITHPSEELSNKIRRDLNQLEPKAQRTYTSSQAILARSAGIFHWTPEGRQLYDFSSGVLVANLGHNPMAWTRRFLNYLGWSNADLKAGKETDYQQSETYFTAVTLTAYNAITNVEMDATQRLLKLMQSRPGGRRMEQVLWAASGSEAVQKALWAALGKDRSRDVILATRHGFHGKKGLAGAVTGTEKDHDRDPRVRFLSFPMCECIDVANRDDDFDFEPYQRELHSLFHQFGHRISALITEPYLGGGGSYHPNKKYLQELQKFCHQYDITFILDEVQANFGRTGKLFAFETYEIEPDIVVLGKGMGNGVPVAAAVGRRDLLSSLGFGEGSDTWSANPMCCAAVLATLDDFENRPVLQHAREMSSIIEQGLIRLKQFPFIQYVRGEKGGMVWGIETCDYANRSANEWANELVRTCYLGEDNKGIHLLGPLAGKVVRVAPPLTITKTEAEEATELLHRTLSRMANLQTAEHHLVSTN